MIGMLVRDQDAVEMLHCFFDGSEAGQCFAFAESGVHKESGTLGLQQGNVAGAAGRQNGDAKADRFPPKRAATNFEMMAERRKSVNEEERVSRRDGRGRG